MRSTPILEPPTEGAEPDLGQPPPVMQDLATPTEISPAPSTTRHGKRWVVIGVIVALLAGVAAALFVLLLPRADIVAESLGAPATIVEGEVLGVEVGVVNSGNATGTSDVTLMVDGVAVDTVTLEIDGDTEATATFRVADLAAGTHLLELDGVADLSHEVWVMTPARFVVDDVELSATEVTLGEQVAATVTYSNVGESEDSHRLVLRIGQQVLDETTVTLTGGTSGTVVMTFTPTNSGNLLLSVGDVTRRLQVRTPARFVIDDVVLSASEVLIGELVTVRVDYSNVGETEGSHHLAIRLPQLQILDETTVELAGGESGTVELTFTPTTPGELRLSIGDVTRLLRVLTPASLELGGVSVSPNPANLHDDAPVTVAVTVTNSGDVDGAETLTLTVDGNVLEQREITVPGRDSVEETFTFVPARPGLQTVDVNGTMVELEVHQLERPGNGTVLLREIGGGPNRLEIVNNRDTDVVVVLTGLGDTRPLLTVYVHADSGTTVRDIGRGEYDAYFTEGWGWCAHYGRFTEFSSHGRFDEPQEFVSGGNIRYTTITLTFGAQDGWSPTRSVSPDDFPGR